MSETQEKFEVVYEKGHAKSTFPVTGAFGGPSPDGATVVAHIYVDHVSVPSISMHDIGPEGQVKLGEGTPISRGNLTREIQATLVFSPEVAVVFGKWLATHGENLLKARG